MIINLRKGNNINRRDNGYRMEKWWLAMMREEFLRKVKEAAGLESVHQADAVVMAVVAVLKAGLPPEQAEMLAASLPEDLRLGGRWSAPIQRISWRGRIYTTRVRRGLRRKRPPPSPRDDGGVGAARAGRPLPHGALGAVSGGQTDYVQG